MLSDAVCSSGWDVINRTLVDGSGWTMVSSAQQMTCDGAITEWKYLPNRARTFRAIVWREVEGKTFKIVGINEIPAAVETCMQVRSSSC